MKAPAILLAAAFLAASAPSSAASKDKGTSSFPFLVMPVDARAAALGEAYTAAADGAEAVYWNPAGLRRMPSARGAAFMHGALVQGGAFDYAAYGQKFGRASALGVGLQSLSFGSIDARDAADASIGRLSPRDSAVTAAYAMETRWLLAGVSGKFIRSSLVGTSSGQAFDAGLMTAPLFNKRLRLAAAVVNVGGAIRREQDSDRLPLTTRLGASCSFAAGWLFLADLGVPRDDDAYGAFGLEHRFRYKDGWSTSLRAGYNTRSRDLGSFSGISGGLGVSRRLFSVDYALSPMGALGLTHRFSISFGF